MRIFGRIKATACAAVVIFFACAGTASAATSIIITNPVQAGTTAIAESNDYAIDNFADPWDFNSVNDVAGYGYENYGMSAFGVSGGRMNGSTATNDAFLFMLHPGVYSAIPTGRDGARHPVSTVAYDTLSFRVNSSASTPMMFYWFYNNVWTSFGVAGINLQSGDRVYHMKIPTYLMGGLWTGTPVGLRLDPGTVAGQSFSFDWIKLHKSGQRMLNVQWTDTALCKPDILYILDRAHGLHFFS